MPTPRHVLITGSSTGIGRACALHLASRGWRVHAGVRREEDGRSLVAEAGNINPVLLDVTDPSSIAAATERVARECGRGGLAGLVNNAGICVSGPVERLEPDQWRRQFEVNLFGQIAVTRAMLPLLRDYAAGAGGAGKRPARIVMVSSIADRIGQPIVSPYCASKAALASVSEALRVELAEQRIGVSIVEPGPVKSEIWRKGFADAAAIDPSDPMLERYRTLIDGVTEIARHSEQAAIPALRAARVVERCLTARRPPARKLVGRDARLSAFLLNVLPARTFDALLLGLVTLAARRSKRA